jgi:polyhydroxybutyrate depolymerase
VADQADISPSPRRGATGSDERRRTTSSSMTSARVASRRVCALVLLGLVASFPSRSLAGAATGPAPTRSAGCTAAGATSRVRPPPGDRASSVTSGGVTHRYLVSVPPTYDPHRPRPLVLLFHGFGSDGSSVAYLTHLPGKGAARGFIVATPDGPNHTWQLSGSGSDAVFIDDLVSKLSSSLCVDPRRVFAAGFSQGAAFAIFYSCARPRHIAAIATVAVDFQLGCTRPTSLLAFHGTADPAVPYQDGAVGLSLPGLKVRGTMLNLGDWARLDRCQPAPTTTVVGTEVARTTWPRCAAHTEVRLYTINGGGHAWPGADPAKNPTYTTQQIDATVLMLDFFGRHHVR